MYVSKFLLSPRLGSIMELKMTSCLSQTICSLIRQDRSVGRGGVVCAFISNSIPNKMWIDLENLLNECLWLSLRPHRRPRNLEHCHGRIIQPPPDKSAQEQRKIVNYLNENSTMLATTPLIVVLSFWETLIT